MAATVRLDYYGGNASEPAGVTAEAGAKFNRADSLAGTTPVPRPTAAGTAYSYVKQLGLNVTGSAATAISNRTVKMGSSPATGLTLAFLGSATYLDQTGASGAPADNGTTNDAAPSGYTAMTTSAQSYHAASVSAGSTGRNGNFCRAVAGVANNYAGGAGSGIALPDIVAGYDEA